MPSFVTTGAEILHAALFVAVLIGVSAGVGRRLQRWLSVPEGGPFAESVVIAILLGAGVLQFVPFALGAAGLLGTASLRLALGVVSLAALPDLWLLARAARRHSAESRPRWFYAWIVALLPGLAVALLLAVTPTLDADGLGYHLTVPKRWLAAGSLSYLPTYTYSNTPMGVEMLFMNALACAGDAAAKLVHFALGVVGAVALYLAGKRLAGRVAGAVAVSSFLCGPMGVGSLLGWAYLEGATCAALIGSALAWLTWYQERSTAWLRCAALLAGIGVSFKITASPFAVALGVLTLLVLGHEAKAERRALFPALTPVFRLIPLLAIPVLPWLVRSGIVTGNPLFPMGAKWIPSRDFSANLAEKFELYNRYMVWGISLGPSWTLERRKIIFVAVALAVALMGVVVASRRRSYIGRSTTWVILGAVLAQLAAVGLYRRYWIPAFSVFQLPLIALFVGTLSARWFQSALVGLTALASLAQAREGLRSVDYDASGMVKTASGLEDQRTYLLKHMALYPLYERANRETPSPSGVVLSQYCGAFYLDPSTYCADITQESLRFVNWDDFVADIRRLHISHVIAPRSWAVLGDRPIMEGGNVSMLVREAEHDCVGRLLREHARLLESASDQGLYAIDVDLLR